MLQKECKVCEQVLHDDPPFCPNCWEKNFTEEELEKSDRVWVIRTKQDFHTYSSEKAKDAPLQTYVLIEGELTQQISEVFNARAKLAIKRNNKRREAAGTVAIGLATVAVQVFTKQAGSKINSSELLKITMPVVAGTVVKGTGLQLGSSDEEEEFKTLAFASECNSMFNANFRLIGKANDYVILRREKAITDAVAEDVRSELKGTASDFKSVAEDVGSVVKKGWNWFKSSKASP